MFLKTDVVDVNNPPARINILTNPNHRCVVDPQRVERLRVVNDLKDQVEANPSAPIKRMYDETVAELRRQPNGPDEEDIPVFEEVSQIMKRKKVQNVPPIPADVDDVVITDTWAQTWDGEGHLMHLDNNW